MPSAEEIRAGQRAMWGKFSAGWEKWDDVVNNTIGDVGESMIDALQIKEDQQHLDVAAGTGEPGLTIARRAPKGHVTLTDIAPEMLAAAQRRAAAQGLTNVSYQECGAEDLPFPDTKLRQRGRPVRVHVHPRHPAGGERVRPSGEAGRPRRHRRVGRPGGQSVGNRSGRGDRDRGADASARSRRSRHVPVRAARHDQQAVRGRGSARREGVGCRHAAGGGLARAVLADGAGAHRSGRDGVAASR